MDKWAQVPGKNAKRIAVDNEGYPIIINEWNEIFMYLGDRFEQIMGFAKDICVMDERIYAVTMSLDAREKGEFGYDIKYLNSKYSDTWIDSGISGQKVACKGKSLWVLGGKTLWNCSNGCKKVPATHMEGEGNL